MPRKGPAPSRPLVNDPVYGSQLVTQLVNKVLLDGKKSIAERIVYGALEQARDKTGTDPAVELGTKGPSLYNHVDSLDDLRHEVRDRVLAEIVGMLHTVSSGRSSEDAILAMAGAYRSYAHHHPGRYAALTRMPFLDAVNRPTIDARELAKPATEAIGVYGLNEDTAFHAGVELWAAMHGFVMLEMTGFMAGIEMDPDTAFAEMVHRFASGLAERK
ncbi:Putative transcriptional regulator, TetR family [Mycobacteroides abscessus subsp. abscessus]|nr:Putative transcriptional regulator, TetR family [Mycobacteroides abscessus subsp. abscessus]